jgi:hypothetical protein
MNGKLAALQLLLARGSDHNAVDDDGSTPLHLACACEGTLHSALECVEALLELGAATGTRDTAHGETPLERAERCERTESAELLLAFDADIPAHIAARRPFFTAKLFQAALRLARLRAEALSGGAAAASAPRKRLLAALAASNASCAFSRLKALRAGGPSCDLSAAAGDAAMPALPPRVRFSLPAERLAHASLLRACAEETHAEAAERAVSLLVRGHVDRSGSREAAKQRYAMVMWVAKLGELSALVQEAMRNEAEALADLEAASATCTKTLELLQEAAEAAAVAVPTTPWATAPIAMIPEDAEEDWEEEEEEAMSPLEWAI